MHAQLDKPYNFDLRKQFIKRFKPTAPEGTCTHHVAAVILEDLGGLCSGFCNEKQEICRPQNSAAHVLGSARRNLKCAFGICDQNSAQKLTSSRSQLISPHPPYRHSLFAPLKPEFCFLLLKRAAHRVTVPWACNWTSDWASERCVMVDAIWLSTQGSAQRIF